MNNFLLKFFLIFFIFTNYSFSSEKIVYLDLDYIIANSNKGKQILSQLEKINLENISLIKSKEEMLKKEEKKIINQKNIISEEMFNQKVKDLKNKIENLKSEKRNMAKSFKSTRENNIKDFIKLVEKILQEYVKDESIDLVLNKKNILMGKNQYNITNNILEKVNQLK